MGKSTNVFKIQDSIIKDYKSYVNSFINIKNDRIRETVEHEINKGKLWPESLISFNPAFATANGLSSLVDSDILHPTMLKVLKGYRLYQHQVDGIKIGNEGKGYIVTSGTGSGKSLIYISTILNSLLAQSDQTPGIKAVIVYPMNALINSQTEELTKFKNNYEKETGQTFPFTFAQYTGQEKQQQRLEIRENLQNIILTNYMMLELILTRIQEKSIRDSIYKSLSFLVFDELHTYRGRQGSDVALLICRIKSKAEKNVLCIGTSATMVSGGSIHDQKEKVAEVASTFFGIPFTSDQVVTETLERSFTYSGSIPDKSILINILQKPIDNNDSYDVLKGHSLAIWLENRVALCESGDVLIRNKPMQYCEIAKLLSEDIGLDVELCTRRLVELLQWVANVNANVSSRDSLLPFKLHQFISQTGAVYITLDQNQEQVITLEPGVYKGSDENKKPLYPVVFSRVSGHEFVCVMKNQDSNRLEPREFNDRADSTEDLTAGYLIIGDDIWDPAIDLESLPDAWLKYSSNGTVTIQKKYANRIPARIFYDEFGKYSEKEELKYAGWFMPTKLLFDPTSGTVYDPKTADRTKLTQLGSEGRSTSTTILSTMILKQLGINGYPLEDQKLLSFTDNRQDAALQAGHFNDYLKVVYLRSAIYRSLFNAENNELDHSTISQAIFDALNLGQDEYASNPSEFPSVKRDNENALKDYLTYRALYDLRRGWRVVLPNLEQCSLLEVHFKYLEENCSINKPWQTVNYFDQMAPSERMHVVYQVLDYFRRSYSICSEVYLNQNQIAQRQKIIYEKLRAPWKFDENEKINEPYFMHYETIKSHSRMFIASIGSNSALGKYLREELKKYGAISIKTAEYNELIANLLDILEQAGWLKSSPVKSRLGEDTKVYQLLIDKIIWRLGNGKSMIPDLVKNWSYKASEEKPNEYFQEVYKTDFQALKKYVGSEHTGQLNTEDRQEREVRFRSGEISSLYCSPTMELGIDIASLNVVHMRNVPPNPANYAQRSGRAGRSGQTAFVYTYCSNYSPHDRHYFNHASDMVAGVVAPPRIDLSNEELLSTHLNALYLAEVGLNDMDQSLANLIDETDRENLPLKENIIESLKIGPAKKRSIMNDFRNITEDFAKNELSGSKWFNDEWISRKIDSFTKNLDCSLNRWRLLYKSAQSQLEHAHQVINSGLYPKTSDEMKKAFRDEHQAIRQRDLLKCSAKGYAGQISEFYPYRYLASEGFLPGYNFTRLPLRTFIPKGNAGEYISRPRFIALREFGPRNVVYHNGSKYRMEQLVTQDIENRAESAKVSINSGYILFGDDYNNEMCPFSQTPLDDNSSRKIFCKNLLEMTETKSEEIERISCEEEERLSTGFDFETYFSVPSGIDSIQTAFVKSDEDKFLKLQYIPAARLFQINTKWRSQIEPGFPIGLTTGRWKKNNQKESAEDIRRVQLYTTVTTDALYIQPIKSLALVPDGVTTLQYALKRAIETVFQIESNEIGVTRMGDPNHPNIFLYEASEGSLGILSQFVEDKDIFEAVIKEAYNLLRFDDVTYLEPASYDDLLSYYNQRDHLIIDRFLIKDALEKLITCNVELITSSSDVNYDEQYERLMRAFDPNSVTERKFLKYLYDNGLRLPDQAQRQVDGVYSQPDFWYSSDFWVFCDGTPHDRPEIKERDKQTRDAIRNKGEQVFVYYYRDNLEEIIAKRPDIFKKVR